MVYLLLFTLGVIAVGGGVLFYSTSKRIDDKLYLSFSGSYLFGLIFLHLLPEVFSGPVSQIGLYVLVGFVLQLILDFISKGIEHGHAHFEYNEFPLAVFVGLCIHSFLKACPSFSTDLMEIQKYCW